MTLSLDPGVLSRLSAWVADQTSLWFPPEKWLDLESRLALSAAEEGFGSLEAYADSLLASEPVPAKRDLLASRLVNSETYFWRDHGLFDALVGTLLPELIRKRASERRLELWCAGCSSGEEAYSLAIALVRAAELPAGWTVTLRATDISERNLGKARRGLYTACLSVTFPRGFSRPTSTGATTVGK